MKAYKIRPPAKERSEANTRKALMLVKRKVIPDDKFESVNEAHEVIYKLAHTYDNSNTKMSFLAFLVDSLKREEDKYREVIVKYNDEAWKINREIRQDYKHALIAENRVGLLTYADCVLKIDELKNSTMNHKDHMIYIALCMNVLQPPLRLEIASMDIVSKDVVNDDNCLVVEDDRMYYKLGKYKTFKTYGTVEIDIVSEDLKKIISNSYELLPRRYLLVNDKGEALGIKGYQRLLAEYLGEGFGCDMFRSNYISWFLNKSPRPCLIEKEELAKQMCHSISSQELFYYKGGS